MTIDHTFMIKKLQKLKEMLVLFSKATRLPFVECDEETFDDLIHVCAEEKKLEEIARAYGEKKVMLVGVKVPNAQAKGFYNSLYSIGVNALMFHEGGCVTRIQLEDLAQKPDADKLAREKVPILNPSLQLSAIYFIQELRRPAEHDMQKLHDLEEEMIANFAKARFIMGLDVTKGEGENPQDQMKIPYVKDKDGNVFQPIFSDFSEFQKHYRAKAASMRMAPVGISQLSKYLVQESKGFVINPAGFNLQLSKEQIGVIINHFPGDQTQ